MKKALRIAGWILVALIVLAGVLYLFNRERVTRLLATTSLFNEDRIVSNFSSMQEIFYTAEISNTGDVEPFGTAPQPLPPSFVADGNSIQTEDYPADTATTSLLVLKDGRITFEDYYLGTTAEDLRISWSVAKSFMSAAFGIAVAEGKIASLDDLLTDYAPTLEGSAYEGVTIRNALNMSTGVKFNEDYLDFWSDINKMGRTIALGSSMDAFAAGISKREREQGVLRKYTSIDTHVLAMVLRGATGRSLIEIIGEQIVSPIGFEKAPRYITDGYDDAFALGGSNLTNRDYSRFGHKIHAQVRWNGEQIIPTQLALT